MRRSTVFQLSAFMAVSRTRLGVFPVAISAGAVLKFPTSSKQSWREHATEDTRKRGLGQQSRVDTKEGTRSEM